MEKRYNGWANYETWLVSLWMDEYGVRGYRGDVYSVGKELREEVEVILEREGMDLGGVGLGVDLLRGVLGGVNWMELASHVLEEEE